MAARDPRVTRYIQGRAPFARPILRHLRRVIHAGGHGLEETIKWGMPTFLHRGRIVCGIAAFRAHCALWFKDGRAVVGSNARAGGMGHFGRIERLADLPSPAKIESYVRKSMHRIDRIER